MLIMAGACYTNKLTISVLEPAKLGLPASIQRISILPLPGVPSKTGVYDSLKFIKPFPDADVNAIKMGYLYGISDVLTSSPRFQKVVIADSSITRFTANGRLFWDDLQKVCTHDTTDVILVLTKAVSRDYYDLSYRNNSWEYYNNDYTLISHTKWVFYLPFKQKELTRFAFSDTLVMSGGFSILEMGYLLYDACYSIGERTGKKLTPHWQNVSRFYFTGPGRQLNKAAGFITKDQWYNAALIWNKLAEDSNVKYASRAAYNLALAYERDDVLDQASLWIAFSDSLSSNAITSSYKKTLADRLKTRPKLVEQLNGK
jgi:hypothetical protein